MPVIHGITFNDDRLQERTAKNLLGSHAGVICLSIILAILQVVGWAVTRGPMEQYQEAVSTESQNRFSSAGATTSGVFSLIIGIIILIGIPSTIYFFARKGLQESNASILQGLCIFDSYCAYCSILGTLSALNTILQYSYISSYVDTVECNPNGVTKDGVFHSGKDNYSQEKCESAIDAWKDLGNAAMATGVITMLICLCQAGACAFATHQANTANGVVKQGKAFVGAPRFNQQNVVACPAQPGMTGAVVVGQPVMGQPVMAQG